jgi:hypothetical protein
MFLDHVGIIILNNTGDVTVDLSLYRYLNHNIETERGDVTNHKMLIRRTLSNVLVNNRYNLLPSKHASFSRLFGSSTISSRYYIEVQTREEDDEDPLKSLKGYLIDRLNQTIMTGSIEFNDQL